MILDKTGTSYGRPSPSGEEYAPPFTRETVLPLVAAVERLSRHPLAGAIVRAAEAARFPLPAVDWIREEPGAGLRGSVAGASVRITNRARAAETFDMPPSQPTGLECVVIVNDRYAATYHSTICRGPKPRPRNRGRATATRTLSCRAIARPR
jgi:cation transport ATPase